MAQNQRGRTSIGFVTDLPGIEAAPVIYLRLWHDAAASQTKVWNDFAAVLGPQNGRKALQSFEDLCGMCASYGRCPLIRHSVQCKCLDSDESCFANFIATAAEGAREDAMLIATLLVRPDVAPLVASLAADFGLAIKRMRLSAPVDYAQAPSQHQTFH